jgi:hypothetical protein
VVGDGEGLSAYPVFDYLSQLFLSATPSYTLFQRKFDIWCTRVFPSKNSPPRGEGIPTPNTKDNENKSHFTSVTLI